MMRTVEPHVISFLEKLCYNGSVAFGNFRSLTTPYDGDSLSLSCELECPSI
jgi:hypothetical protein